MANASLPKLEDILDSVPEHQRHKLDNRIDSDLRHIGLIASKFSTWDGRVADELNLTAVEVSDIKCGPNRDNLEQQRWVRYVCHYAIIIAWPYRDSVGQGAPLFILTFQLQGAMVSRLAAFKLIQCNHKCRSLNGILV